MAVFSRVYGFISRSFKYGPVKRTKSLLRPLKHFLFGKSGIYAAIVTIEQMRKEKHSAEIGTVFDIGAAIGDTAVTFLGSFPRAHVYCFEPLTDSFVELKKQTARFGNRAHCFNFGLSDTNGEAKMLVSKNRDSSSFINIEGADANVCLVKTRRLDDIVGELAIKKIDFMKIDAEGWEKEIMDGGEDTFQNKTESLFIEINPTYYRGQRRCLYVEVLDKISKAGFSWVGIFGDFLFTKL